MEFAFWPLVAVSILSFVAAWMYLNRVNSALASMSDDELLDEAYAEAEWGNFPNAYSREYDRRTMFGARK